MTVDYFTGVQPTAANLHLGNYFGAIKPAIELAKTGASALYFVADLHALTVQPDPTALRQQINNVAATYMALGLPENVPIFRQSDILEVGSLSFILSCNLGFGHLERMHAFKDKVAKGLTPNAGLAFYPVLMAADILMYNPTNVPVGGDQDQHLQLTQQVARAFNARYGDVFNVPAPHFSAAPKVVGTDGQKMSKSYRNTIDIFAQGAELSQQLKSIVTDSRPLEQPKEPDFPLAQILYLFLDANEKMQLTARMAAGGVGYGEMKSLLASKIDAEFGSARQLYSHLVNDPDGKAKVQDRLGAGATIAASIAKRTMNTVLSAVGCRPAIQA